MKKRFSGLLAACLIALLTTPVYAALPAETGMITSCSAVSGSEFTPSSTIAAKLDKMFAGNIGLYKDKNKTKLVNAALGTRNVPNNGVWQYWGPTPRAGTSCFAYANAFYCTFYDGVYPHHEINSNHQKVKATGRISYENFVKWGVRDDAPVYIREGNHSIIVLHYDKDYITYVDGNGDARGLIAIRKEAWKRGSGANLYNQKPSLIVQPTTAYFPAGSLQKKKPVPCTEGGNFHDWNPGEVTKTATCKESGLKVYTCLACGKTKEEAIAKTADHAYGSWTVTREATCASAGEKVAVCKICGREQPDKIKALGHAYGKTVTLQEATIYSAGVVERTCSRCGKVKKSNTDCAFREETLGITLTTQEGVFPENTEITVTTPGKSTQDYADAERVLLYVTGKMLPYVWDVRAEGESVQPQGKVAVEVAIPEDFGENLELYTVTGNQAQALPCTWNQEKRTVTLELENFQTLALCDRDVPGIQPTAPVEESFEPETLPPTQPTVPATVAPSEEPEQMSVWSSPYVLLVSIAAVLLMGVGITVTVVLLRKRKIPEELPESVYL